MRTIYSHSVTVVRCIFLFLKETVENLMTGMSKINESKVKLSASAIASIMDTENIQKIARDFSFEVFQ